MNSLSLASLASTPPAQQSIQQEKTAQPEEKFKVNQMLVESQTRVNEAIVTQTAQAMAKVKDSNVSIGAQEQPLELVYKAAIEGINEQLALAGDVSIQETYDSGLDTSPEATADRIISFTTGHFENYQKNHPDLSLEDQLDGFMKLTLESVEKGFNEARDILDGLGVLEGKVAEDIDLTFSLIDEKLSAFQDSILEEAGIVPEIEPEAPVEGLPPEEAPHI